MPAVVESSLSSDRPALLLYSGQGTTPLFGLGFLATDNHTSLTDLPSNRRLTFDLPFPRLLLKLNNNLRPCWLRDIGNEMLDIKFILIELLLYLPLNLIHTTIVLTLQLSAFVVVVGVVTEEALFCGFEDLTDFAEAEL